MLLKLVGIDSLSFATQRILLQKWDLVCKAALKTIGPIEILVIMITFLIIVYWELNNKRSRVTLLDGERGALHFYRKSLKMDVF